MDNLVEILWDQERGPHQLFGRVMSWRVSFFILDSHELESQLFHPPQKILTNEGCGDVKSQLFIRHMKSSPSKDIWWWAGRSNIHPINDFLTIEGFMWWWAGGSNIHPLNEFLTIEGYCAELESPIFIHLMNFLLLKVIYGYELEGQIFIH